LEDLIKLIHADGMLGARFNSDQIVLWLNQFAEAGGGELCRSDSIRRVDGGMAGDAKDDDHPRVYDPAEFGNQQEVAFLAAQDTAEYRTDVREGQVGFMA
jgi:hypothetical protein